MKIIICTQTEKGHEVAGERAVAVEYNADVNRIFPFSMSKAVHQVFLFEFFFFQANGLARVHELCRS